MQRSVEFNEQKMPFARRGKKNKRPMMVRWMMKLPFVKTEAQANIGLVLIMIAALAASYLILNDTFSFTGSSEQTYIEDLTEEQREELPPQLLEALPSRTDNQ